MKRNEAGARAVRDAHGHSGGRGRPARSHYGEMPLAAWGGTEDAAPKRRRCAAWLYRQSPHPVPNLRGSSALRRTPQRMASGGSPLCACPRVAGGVSALARNVDGAPQGGARFEAMALARPCGARQQRCCALRRSISPRLFIFRRGAWRLSCASAR